MFITDPLTGLYNRHYLHKVANKMINNKRKEAHLSAVIMVDLDYFKSYNDHYGHVEGDKCLMSVPTVLKRSLYRSEDMIWIVNTNLDSFFKVM